jgi:hypothetical protein
MASATCAYVSPREWPERDFERCTLSAVSAVEREFGEYVARTQHGHRVLWASFMTFFHDTIFCAKAAYAGHATERLAPHHPAIFADFTTRFRSFRAAESLLYAGYPLDGYALLRDLKDEAALLAALAAGETDYLTLKGLSPTSDERTRTQVRKAREREENRILATFYGDSNGLSESFSTAIRRWNALFHAEVHGSRLTATDVVDWFRGESPFELAPTPKQRPIALYVSSVPVIAWMFHRCLPFLQLPGRQFGEQWTAKWEILEESFRWMLSTWSSPSMETGAALTQLIDSRFAFNSAMVYVEHPATTQRK